MDKLKIIILGGGPAGMLASIGARDENPDAEIILIEKNDKLGRKLFLTGKGRGNLTNDRECLSEEFLSMYLGNGKFLYPAFKMFDNRNIKSLLNENGLRLVTERGGRVFPSSGHAYHITDTLKKAIKKRNVDILYKTRVSEILFKDGKIEGVIANGRKMFCDRLIISTGGLSYPDTGSTGDGFRFSREMGINVTGLFPGLTSIKTEEDISSLEGLCLKNVSARIKDEKGKIFFEGFGEIEFKGGLRGAVMLKASSYITEYLNEPFNKSGEKRKCCLPLTSYIDLKPALSFEELDRRIIRETEDIKKGTVTDLLKRLLPEKLISYYLLSLPGSMEKNKSLQELNRSERHLIARHLKALPFTVRGTGGFREAIITRGGIDLKEIDPNTYEAKKIKGLYFAGEIIDLDACTGGYNMQMAFSTGYLAGRSSAKKEL